MNHPVPTDSTSLSCKMGVRAAAVCILIIPPRPCHYSSHEDRAGEHLKDGAHFPARGLPLITAIVADCSWTRGGKKMQRGRCLQEMKTDETVLAQLHVFSFEMWQFLCSPEQVTDGCLRAWKWLMFWLHDCFHPTIVKALEMGTVTETIVPVCIFPWARFLCGVYKIL